MSNISSLNIPSDAAFPPIINQDTKRSAAGYEAAETAALKTNTMDGK